MSILRTIGPAVVLRILHQPLIVVILFVFCCLCCHMYFLFCCICMLTVVRSSIRLSGLRDNRDVPVSLLFSIRQTLLSRSFERRRWAP